VGGGPAGIVAANTTRKNYPDKEVTILRGEEKVLIPCGIPYIFGTLDDLEDDAITDKILEENNIQLIIDEATSINKEEKTVSTAGGKEIGYWKLVLATGSNPIKPPIKGIDLDGVYFIQKNIDYLRELKKKVEEASNIVIVGGGFIGAEMASELRKKDKNVAVIEAMPSMLYGAFDPEFCRIAEEKLKEVGVEIHTNTRVEEILGGEKAESVRLSTNKSLITDIVIMCIGAKANSELAEKASLELDSRGGILVDEYMRTSHKDILAVGDCSGNRDFFTIGTSSILLASTATSEARVAGENMFQLKVIKRNKGTIGIFSTSINGLVLGTAGLTEEKAKEGGFEYIVGEHKTMDRHPGCMPDASQMTVKLVFSKDSEVLLGGQIVGGKTAGEVINMIGLAVQNHMTLADINNLQIGTHPLLTPAPTTYPFIVAAQNALTKIEKIMEVDKK
jgi:NADH oxidase (H2O2-forming)